MTVPDRVVDTPCAPASRPATSQAQEGWVRTEGVTCVSCPDCAFTFDADHSEDGSGTYDCPACMEHRSLYLQCPVCRKRKWASTPERAVYLLAFHMDRRHRGWSA